MSEINDSFSVAGDLNGILNTNSKTVDFYNQFVKTYALGEEALRINNEKGFGAYTKYLDEHFKQTFPDATTHELMVMSGRAILTAAVNSEAIGTNLLATTKNEKVRETIEFLKSSLGTDISVEEVVTGVVMASDIPADVVLIGGMAVYQTGIPQMIYDNTLAGTNVAKVEVPTGVFTTPTGETAYNYTEIAIGFPEVEYDFPFDKELYYDIKKEIFSNDVSNYVDKIADGTTGNAYWNFGKWLADSEVGIISSDAFFGFFDKLNDLGSYLGSELYELTHDEIALNSSQSGNQETLRVIRRDPLTLDLDGDGIETVSADGSVLFDSNADGIKRGTGWVAA